MTSLSLKFQQTVLQEVVLTGGVVTIGRQPDNLVRIDNPIVSGYHAKIYCENGGYVLEDLESFNGTYVDNRRVRKATLKHGDVVLVGKHVIQFHDQADAPSEGFSSATRDRSGIWQAEVEKSRPPQLETTMVVDTNKMKEMLAKMVNASSTASASAVPGKPVSRWKTYSTANRNFARPSSPAALDCSLELGASGHREIGTVTIVAGRTQRSHYVLSSKLNVIGKSSMASIRLKRWFAPKIAASIHQRGDGYFLVAAARNITIRINNQEVVGGQRELHSGDQFQVAGITAKFGYEKG